ncbi:hypothetical protein ACFL0U_03640 [Pseudomonadota bacterium]
MRLTAFLSLVITITISIFLFILFGIIFLYLLLAISLVVIPVILITKIRLFFLSRINKNGVYKYKRKYGDDGVTIIDQETIEIVSKKSKKNS